jgi:polyisoprenoid-binding protein YceI
MKNYFFSHTIVLILFILAITVSVSAQTKWTPVSATVSFKIKNAGIMVDGSFTGLTGTVLFDPEHLAHSSIEASINSASINTGIELRNTHLKKEEYFNVEKFPKISMKSTSFEKLSDGTYKGHFQLTLKGVTKAVVVPFTFIETGNSAVFKGSFTIVREDYGIGGSSWTMGDEVTINIQLNVTK